MSARPTTAAPGRPPVTTLPSTARSGRDADQLLVAAGAVAEASDDLVVDQQHAALRGQLAQGAIELVAQRHRAPRGAGRLQHERADVWLLEQRLLDARQVGRDHDDRLQRGRWNAERDRSVERRRGALAHAVVPAAEVAFEAQHLLFAR